MSEEHMHPILTGKRTVVDLTTSNGNAGKQFGPGAVSGQIVYAAGLAFFNTSATTDHTLTISSSGGTDLQTIPLPKGQGFWFDGAINRLESEPGEFFKFRHDGAGGAGDISVSGSVVQHS
jgi:hypothetical protein